MSLKRQVASGFFWVTLAQLASRGLSFVTMLILAKLLTPSIFGLVGMAGLAIAALQYFQDAGFDAALVYRREEVEAASHTAFLVVLASSLVIYLVAVLAAPLVAAFFREEAVTPILRVLALSIPISGLTRVPYTLLSRDLNFRRKIMPELLANVIGSSLAIGLAFNGAGVWSLVWGQLTRAGLATVFVWFVTAWRPQLRFNPRLAREMFHYGKHIVSSQTLIFLITNVDNAVVGRYVGQAALGFYQFAYNLSNTPATQITSIVSQVMFPTFAKLSGVEVGQMRARYYLTTLRYISWITIPTAIAMSFFAPEFIIGLYGTTWAPAIVPLQLLAFYGLIRSLAANMGSIYRAMGKPEWLTYIAIWRLATMLLLLYPAVLWGGIIGVSILSVAVAVVDFAISAILANRLVATPWRAYARLLLPTVAAALIAGVISHWSYPHIPLVKTALRLLFAGALMSVIYGGLIWLTDHELREAARKLYRELRGWWERRTAAVLPDASTRIQP